MRRRKPQSTDSVLTPRALLAMGAIATLCSGLTFLFLWASDRATGTTASWTPVPCTITHSQVRDWFEQSRVGTLRHYDVEVRFRYTVAGRTFEGERFTLTRQPLLKLAADDAVSRFPAGAQATCFYDPQQPDQSVLLRTDPDRRDASLLWVVGAILGISLLVFLAGAIGKFSRQA